MTNFWVSHRGTVFVSVTSAILFVRVLLVLLAVHRWTRNWVTCSLRDCFLSARAAVREGRSPMSECVARSIASRRIRNMRACASMLFNVLCLVLLSALYNVFAGKARWMTPAQDVILMVGTSGFGLVTVFPNLVDGKTVSTFYAVLMLSSTVFIGFVAHEQALVIVATTALYFVRLMASVANLSVLAALFWNFLYGTVAVAGFYQASLTAGPSPLTVNMYIVYESVISCIVVICSAAWLRCSCFEETAELLRWAQKSERAAATALLNTVCDAVTLLDTDLTIQNQAAELAATLVHGPGRSLMGTVLPQLIVPEDREMFQERVIGHAADSSTDVFRASVRDCLGNCIRMEVFHVAFSSLNSQTCHLVGFKEVQSETQGICDGLEQRVPSKGKSGRSSKRSSGGTGWNASAASSLHPEAESKSQSRQGALLPQNSSPSPSAVDGLRNGLEQQGPSNGMSGRSASKRSSRGAGSKSSPASSDHSEAESTSQWRQEVLLAQSSSLSVAGGSGSCEEASAEATDVPTRSGASSPRPKGKISRVRQFVTDADTADDDSSDAGSQSPHRATFLLDIFTLSVIDCSPSFDIDGSGPLVRGTNFRELLVEGENVEFLTNLLDRATRLLQASAEQPRDTFSTTITLQAPAQGLRPMHLVIVMQCEVELRDAPRAQGSSGSLGAESQGASPNPEIVAQVMIKDTVRQWRRDPHASRKLSGLGSRRRRVKNGSGTDSESGESTLGESFSSARLAARPAVCLKL